MKIITSGNIVLRFVSEYRRDLKPRLVAITALVNEIACLRRDNGVGGQSPGRSVRERSDGRVGTGGLPEAFRFATHIMQWNVGDEVPKLESLNRSDSDTIPGGN
jgi:hypothetical protein